MMINHGMNLLSTHVPWRRLTVLLKMVMLKLSNMRKDRVYCVTIAIKESTCCVVTAYCTYPAGLSGCCNHITSTLYCLEDFVRRGLREERMGCTEMWNHAQQMM